MRLSLFWKIFGGYLLVILILTGSLYFVSSHLIREFSLSTLSRDLVSLGKALNLRIIPFLEEERFEEMDAFVKAFGKDINTRITVVNREGVVLADSEEDPSRMENHRSRPEIATAFRGSVGKSLRYSTTVKEEMLYVSLPVKRDGETAYALRVSLFVADIDNLLADLRKGIGQMVLVLTLVFLLGTFVFSRSLTRPIRELGDASRRVASGDFEAKVFLKGRDELRELAEGFNFMTERIESLFENLSRQKTELDGILSSMEEGIMAVDRNGRILFCNDSIHRMSRCDRVQGRFYWEVLRELRLEDLIKMVFREKKNSAMEMSIGERIFLCSVVLLESGEEAVITFRDISDVKKMERMKKDFIMNVSHELRTPLTAIKGFVETLEGNIKGKSRDYVRIIKRHTDRLISIVDDLLLLSEVEELEQKPEKEDVNMKKLSESVCRMFGPKAEEKGLVLEFAPESGIPPIQGDPFKLEQMLINLIDNAVKYTERGKVTVSLKKKNEGWLSIEIQDTGIGIPHKHLDRIFERFYVIDKSRSRKLGGTGLGLSIVKHIVLMHKGEVKAESTPGKGTTFTVLLPV
ncbi:MAG: ATP-binding protein [Candidatus Aminicenantales bacterium]